MKLFEHTGGRWLGKRRDYKMPEVTTPYIDPPSQEKEAVTIYSIGVTDQGTHMTFIMGHTTLTMTKIGCEQLIEQLEVFKNQLKVLD